MYENLKILLLYFIFTPIFSKGIIIPQNNDTYTYQEYISESEVKFEFQVKKKAAIKIELLNEVDNKGEGNLNLSYYYYTRTISGLKKIVVNLIENEKINSGKGYNRTNDLPYVNSMQGFSLSYTYSKKHTILLKFLFSDAEYYTMKLNNDTENQQILNITSIYDNEFYLKIILNNLENGENLYTKITQDNFGEIDEILCLQKDGIDNFLLNEIIKLFENKNETKCDGNYTSNNNVTILTNQKKNNIIFMKFKLKKSDKDVKKSNIYLSLFKKELVEFESGKYVKEISKYHGFYLVLDLTKNENYFDYLMYTNISKSMKIFYFTHEQNNSFIIEEAEEEITYTKILCLNSTNKLNHGYILFIDKIIEEDFSFILLKININEASILLNINPIQKSEKIDFQTFKDENEKSIKYIIINNDYLKTDNIENYFYFYEEIAGSVQAKIFDLDNNILLKEAKNIYDPQIIPEDHSVLIILYTSGDYKYKMYSLKCLNYNNMKINYGDNIQICLNPRKSTNFNIQFSSKYAIKLLISDKTDMQYSVKIKLTNDNNFYYINSTNKEYYREENSTKYYISLINDGSFISIINLKFSLEDSKKINYLENSIDETKIKNETLYALLLPKNKEINSVFQELNFKGDNTEICFDFDIMKNNITTYPPKNSCFIFSNEIYNFNLTVIEDIEINYYTLIYFKKGYSESVLLNYKKILIYSTGMIENIKNNITTTKDICFLQFKNYKDNSYLFLQIIKENNQNLISDISSKYIDKNNITKFKKIKNLNSTEGKLISTNIININPAENTIPYLKLTSPQNLFIFYKFYNDSKYISFKEIKDQSFSGEFNLSNINSYILNFKPVDEEGTALYNIILIEDKNPPSLEKLFNPYFLMSQNYNKTIEASSNNSTFTETFDISIPDINSSYWIAMLAQRKCPVSYKIYTPFITKNITTIEKNINLTEIKNITNYNIEVNLTDTEQLLVIKAFYETNGTLITQSIVDPKKLTQICYIKEDDNTTNPCDINNSNSYSFNISKNKNLNQSFNFTILFQKKQNKTENLTQKIFFEFISSEVADNYNEESEIKYRILNDTKISYYINSTNNFEIIKMKKNFSKILINQIVVKELIYYYEKPYEKNYIMKFSDDEYYFEFCYDGKNTTRKLYSLEITINLNISNDYIFGNDIREFKVSRVKANNLENVTENIDVSKEPLFYYIDSTILKSDDKYYGLLLYNKDLKDSVKLQIGIYNSYSYPNLFEMENSFYYIEKNSFKNKDYILVLFLRAEIKQNGIIDYFMNDKLLAIDNNCNRASFYKRTEKFKNNKTNEKYYICYTNNDTKNYRFSYKINKESPSNKFYLSYYNDISNSKNSIEGIFNDTKTKIVNSNFFKMEGDAEILYLKYNITDDQVELTMKSEEYDYIQGGGNSGIIYSLSILFTLLLIVGGIYVYKIKNYKSESDEIISQQMKLFEGEDVEDIMD